MGKRLLGVKVLVLEDDTELREVIVEYLTMDGAEVSQAPSGSEGFGAFVLAHPKVIVSDLWMPDGDGYDFIRRVRRLPPGAGGERQGCCRVKFKKARLRQRGAAAA